MNIKVIRLLILTVATCLTIIGGYGVRQSQAIQLQNGTVYFLEPPSLVKAETTYHEVNVWGATYYFTLNLPPNAGEPLQRVTINEYEGVDDVDFRLKHTSAVATAPDKHKQKLQVTDVTVDHKTRTISLTFNPPVSPGENIEIALYPDQNPMTPGVYLFGVTAFPPGEKVHGQFLGYGRLQFYSPSIDF